MDEVPANKLGRWLTGHCCRCGAMLTGLEQEWLARNAQWAEEADAATLETWQARLRMDSLDEVREEVARGLLCDHPAYYTIRARVPGRQDCDVHAGSYCICPGCLEAAFEDKPQRPAPPAHRWSGLLDSD